VNISDIKSGINCETILLFMENKNFITEIIVKTIVKEAKLETVSKESILKNQTVIAELETEKRVKQMLER
jgi:membrane-bound lytic murein transglycosylase D